MGRDAGLRTPGEAWVDVSCGQGVWGEPDKTE